MHVCMLGAIHQSEHYATSNNVANSWGQPCASSQHTFTNVKVSKSVYTEIWQHFGAVCISSCLLIPQSCKSQLDIKIILKVGAFHKYKKAFDRV